MQASGTTMFFHDMGISEATSRTWQRAVGFVTSLGTCWRWLPFTKSGKGGCGEPWQKDHGDHHSSSFWDLEVGPCNLHCWDRQKLRTFNPNYQAAKTLGWLRQRRSQFRRSPSLINHHQPSSTDKHHPHWPLHGSRFGASARDSEIPLHWTKCNSTPKKHIRLRANNASARSSEPKTDSFVSLRES